MASRKIVQPDDRLTEREQLFEQIGADETSDTRDQPGSRVVSEISTQSIVGPGTNTTDHLRVPSGGNGGQAKRARCAQGERHKCGKRKPTQASSIPLHGGG